MFMYMHDLCQSVETRSNTADLTLWAAAVARILLLRGQQQPDIRSNDWQSSVPADTVEYRPCGAGQVGGGRWNLAFGCCVLAVNTRLSTHT